VKKRTVGTLGRADQAGDHLTSVIRGLQRLRADALTQEWASHKSVRRKDGSDDDRPPEDWHGEKRSNETHASTSDPEGRLVRKSSAAPALPS
jgi:hypothetical protein